MSDATPMGDEELREFAQGALDTHTPEKQDDNPYRRCAHCHYTRHPCDTYDLAAATLMLLDRSEKVEGYVWCDKDGAIHDDSLNPYGYIEDSNYCLPEYHRALYVRKESE